MICGMKILLLEDDIALNRAIKKVLELDHHSVSSFTDGEEVKQALSGDFDLYILDINVPNVTGLELLGMILRANEQAKVMMISANTDLESLEKAYGIGCVDYIKKPFHIAELRAKISRFNITTPALLSKVRLVPGTENLTKKEKKLLTLLLEHMGEVVNYDLIANSVYNNKPMSMDALRALVRRLRTKLADDIISNMLDEGYAIMSLSPEKSSEKDYSDISSRIEALRKENMQLKVEREALLKKSTTDPLTGLYNRIKIEEGFLYEQQLYLHNQTPLSVILIDLDNFKAINDSHGHNTGDKYLQKFAKTLQEFCKNDDMIGRWGGEEFIILLPKTSLVEAAARAERLKDTVQNIDCPLIGRRTASFGIASIKDHDTLTSLVSRADEALLIAKTLGKNRVETYHPAETAQHPY